MSPKGAADLNEILFEIRFKANARLVDQRGSWAANLSSELGFGEWQIGPDRVDLKDKDGLRIAFVGHKNCGFRVSNNVNADDFNQSARKVIACFFKLSAFGDAAHIGRIGVRCRFVTPYDDTFEKLRKVFIQKYFGPTEAASKCMGDSTLIDIGAPINFTDKLGKYNTVAGPMRTSQMKQFFETDLEFPAVGLYFDIDYMKLPESVLDESGVANDICAFSSRAWDRHGAIRELIVGK